MIARAIFSKAFSVKFVRIEEEGFNVTFWVEETRVIHRTGSCVNDDFSGKYIAY